VDRPASRPRPAAAFASALALLLLSAAPAPAVIVRLLPLKEVIAEEPMIFVASVDAVAPEKPGAVFKFEEKLKGEVPFDRLAVNLTGDAEAKKGGHTKVMLDRLAPGRKLIVFARKKGTRYEAMVFLEGTWFSLLGTPDGDGKAVRWAFLHCEPYLRRTFKGTTAELKKVVEDALAKRADPPPVNEKEPPGYGPPAEKKCDDPAETVSRESKTSAPRDAASGVALFAVIPSFVLVGPLALIAALFPGVAARLAVGMRRWRAFLVVASLNGTLAIAYYFLRPYLPDHWAAGLEAFTAYLLLITAVGLIWAGRRYRRMAAEEPAVTRTPGRSELRTLAGLTVLVGLLVASVRLFGPWRAALEPPMREFTCIGIALVAATLYAGYRAATRAADGPDPAVRLSLSGETVGLGALFLCGAVALLAESGGSSQPLAVGTEAGEAADALGPRLANVRVFEVPDAHQVMSGVTVDGDRLYFGAARQTGFGVSGFVFCLDRHTGSRHWTFDADGDLKPVFCTPTVADGRVYFGEGLHTDSGCKLYCVDAATGRPAWPKPFETASHTEGTPRVVNGRVYFSAGDDGLFCADAATGAKVWQFPEPGGEPLHIDTPPAVAGGRLFAGSGYGTFALVCLDAATGQPLWRVPANLRSFGPPLAAGKHVCYGLGTGNLTLDTEGDEQTPAGTVVCLNADDGKEVWRYDLTRSVHTELAADAFSVYATSRDGSVHCLDRRTGKLRWKTGLGATITAGPAVATAGGMPVAVYAVSTEGLMACLNPHTGRVVWARNLREHTGREVLDVFSTPAVVTEPTPTGSKRTVYVGAMLRNWSNGAKAAGVFRFDDQIGD
jgi:outer membrane protein assembly factor BamB